MSFWTRAFLALALAYTLVSLINFTLFLIVVCASYIPAERARCETPSFPYFAAVNSVEIAFGVVVVVSMSLGMLAIYNFDAPRLQHFWKTELLVVVTYLLVLGTDNAVAREQRGVEDQVAALVYFAAASLGGGWYVWGVKELADAIQSGAIQGHYGVPMRILHRRARLALDSAAGPSPSPQGPPAQRVAPLSTQ